MFIEVHKAEITQAIREAGDPSPAAFQRYVSAQLDGMTEAELATYADKAQQVNMQATQAANELDSESIAMYVQFTVM